MACVVCGAGRGEQHGSHENSSYAKTRVLVAALGGNTGELDAIIDRMTRTELIALRDALREVDSAALRRQGELIREAWVKGRPGWLNGKTTMTGEF